MTDFCCSVCFAQHDLTIIAGTVLCKQCVADVAKQYQDKENSNTLKGIMAHEITKNAMGDIYD